MRVTQQMTISRATKDLQRAMQKYSESQLKVSSGKRWHRASDDPIAVRQAASYKSQNNRIEQYRRNGQRANGRLSYAESTLNELGNSYTRLKSLVVQAASDTTTATDREKIAEEVSSIKAHLLQLANTKLEGQHLFAGSQTSGVPYVVENGGSIDYRGNSEELIIQVGDDATLAYNIPGREIFGDASSGLFHTLGTLEDALRGNDTTTIQWSMGKLDEHQDTTLSARARIGARMNYLDTIEDSSSAAQYELDVATSQVADVDLAEAVTELAQYETQYQATASATAQAINTSILDYLV